MIHFSDMVAGIASTVAL